MDLTLLLLCGVALLAGKCQSGVVIQPCPSGQMNVSEYTNVSFSCGPCTNSIDWYMDCSNPHSTRYQYLGGCKKTDCTFQADSSFRLKATTTETGQLDGALDIVRVTRNDACRVLCKCYRYYFYYNSSADNGYYLEGNGSCQIFVEESVSEVKQQSPESSNSWWRWAVIGGASGLVLIIVIIVIVIILCRRKRRKETQVKGKPNLSFQLCPEDLYDQEKPLSLHYAVSNNLKSEPTTKREPTALGNLYTVPVAVNPLYGKKENKTVNQTAHNTMSERNRGLNHQTSRVGSNPASRPAVKPTPKPKPASLKRRDLNNTPAIGYMNNTKVTGSGSGEYNDPWDIMPSLTEPYTRDSYAAAVSRYDHNYLQLNDDYLQFNPVYPRQKGRDPASYSNECFI